MGSKGIVQQKKGFMLALTLAIGEDVVEGNGCNNGGEGHPWEEPSSAVIYQLS